MPINALTGNTRHPFAQVIAVASVAAAYALTAFAASALARRGLFTWPAPAPSDILNWPAQYVVLLLIAVLARTAIATHYARQPGADNSFGTPITQAGRATMLWAAGIGASIFLFKLSDVSRMFVLSFLCLGSALSFLFNALQRLLGANQQHKHRVALVIGHGAQGDWLTAYLRKHFSPRPYALVKRLQPDDLRTLGNRLLAEPTAPLDPEGSIIEAFVTGVDISKEACELIPILLKSGAKTHLLPAVFDASMFRLHLSDIGGVPAVTVRGGQLDPLEAAVKRIVDFAGGLIALMLVSPLIAVISILVKTSSPGPVLFRQERLGKNGKSIYIYKFRTMHRDAETILKANDRLYSEYLRNNYKLPKDKDPRVTPIGRILRQTSLDELPQLINVIKGEMSLVGPRPVVPEEIRRYGDCAAMILSVQPGLTGQWQVSGRSDIADYAQRVHLDMEYLRDQSIATDLRILAKTVPAVLLRQGAH
jgi:exopolysaccharide production protein ExoY